jgi:WD40 repeat protein
MSMRILFNLSFAVCVGNCLCGTATRLQAAPPLETELAIGDRKDIKVQGVVFARWMSFSPSGKWLALRHALNERADRIQLWNCETWKNHHWDVECKPDKLGVASCCSFDEKDRLLYFHSGNQLYAQTLPPSEWKLIYSHPKDLVGAYSSVFRIDGNGTLLTLLIEADRVHVSIVRPEGTNPEWARTHRLRDVKPLRLLTATDVTGDGSLFASALNRSADKEEASQEHLVEIHTRNEGRRVFVGSGHRTSINTVRFTADAKSIVSGSADGEVRIWDVASGKQVTSFVQDYSISSIDTARAGRLIAYTSFEDGGHENVYIADWNDGRRVGAWMADNRGALRVVFHPGGKYVATYGAEGIVRIWDISRLAQK